MADSLQEFMDEIRSVWGDGRDPALPSRAQVIMGRFLARARPDEPWLADLRREAPLRRELYRGTELGFVVMGCVLANRQPFTPEPVRFGQGNGH